MPRGPDGKFVRADGSISGTYVDEKGYPRISAGKHRGVRVHTLVAQAMLGRELLKHEDVHHKDGDRLNPHWTNLQVVDHRTHGHISSRQAQYKKREEERERKHWESVIPGGTAFEITEADLGYARDIDGTLTGPDGSADMPQ